MFGYMLESLLVYSSPLEWQELLGATTELEKINMYEDFLHSLQFHKRSIENVLWQPGVIYSKKSFQKENIMDCHWYGSAPRPSLKI